MMVARPSASTPYAPSAPAAGACSSARIRTSAQLALPVRNSSVGCGRTSKIPRQNWLAGPRTQRETMGGEFSLLEMAEAQRTGKKPLFSSPARRRSVGCRRVSCAVLRKHVHRETAASRPVQHRGESPTIAPQNTPSRHSSGGGGPASATGRQGNSPKGRRSAPPASEGGSARGTTSGRRDAGTRRRRRSAAPEGPGVPRSRP